MYTFSIKVETRYCSTQLNRRLWTLPSAHPTCSGLFEPKKEAITLDKWHTLFLRISPMWFCPTPCSAIRYKRFNLPSVLDTSHSKPWWKRSKGESGQTIRGLVKGYYLSGHGSLHIFHGCSQGVFSQLLVQRIHLKHMWVTCGLHKTRLQLKNKQNMKRKMRSEGPLWFIRALLHLASSHTIYGNHLRVFVFIFSFPLWKGWFSTTKVETQTQCEFWYNNKYGRTFNLYC